MTTRIYAPSGSAPALGAARLSRSAGITPAKTGSGIASRLATVTRRAMSVAAGIAEGIAEQRDRQAKEIVAYYGQDRFSDSMEREIDPAKSGR